MESSLSKLSKANCSSLSSPTFYSRYLISPLSPASYFSKYPLDHSFQRSWPSVVQWSAFWLVTRAVRCASLWYVLSYRDQNFFSSKVLWSFRTCALNLAQPLMTCELRQGTVPQSSVSSLMKSTWLSPPGFLYASSMAPPWTKRRERWGN